MATLKNNNSEQDRFALIAANPDLCMGVIPFMDEIPPIKIKHKLLDECKVQDVKLTSFDEEMEYNAFLNKKAQLKEHYMPFLQNLSSPLPIVEEVTPIVNFDFRKETDDDKLDFSLVLNGKGKWEKVTIPHYVGPEGRWNAFYRTTLDIDRKKEDKQYILDFQAVDYIGEIYLNGRLLYSHEGFFAPFKVDITNNVKDGKNILVVAIKDDYTTTGSASIGGGSTVYGTKIYGATHLGYDEPNLGWHHCPSGAGIYGKVNLIVSNKVRVEDIFVRPDIDNSLITVNTTIFNYYNEFKKDYSLNIKVETRNFEGGVVSKKDVKLKPLQNDTNYNEVKMDIKKFKLWTMDKPFLYEITVSVLDENNQVVSNMQTHFGMRKFYMDINSKPYKGQFFFNNERIILRGTNEMGHLPKAVMQGNFDQLLDDIMTAKVCHLNFYRMTQRPVLKEIYDYFDMTGMLCQSDFPLFGYINPICIGEAVKQVYQMELHTRNHPSIIIESFINESFDNTATGKEQYTLDRLNLEKLLNSFKEIVEISNPDRVIKYTEGDYAKLPYSYGISDFHMYNYWYVSHGIESGKMSKGYIPPVKKGWMCSCGEYGVDGLDRLELLKKYCPKEWLPKNDDDFWTPKTIAKGQCFTLHGAFFPEQTNIKDWIEKSREWQRIAIKEYVHSLRRRTDMIESTCVHLLIDAWPCGWTKTLVDVDRIPKPAYYEFMKANIPVRVSLRRDRYTLYCGENIVTEVYALNDTNKLCHGKGVVTIYLNNKATKSYSIDTDINPISSDYKGEIKFKLPKDFIGDVRVACKFTANGTVTEDFVDYKVRCKFIKATKTPLIYGEKIKDIVNICSGEVDENLIFTDLENFNKNKKDFEKKAENGAKLVVFFDDTCEVLGKKIDVWKHPQAGSNMATYLAYRNPLSRYTKEFGELDFNHFYNKDTDCEELVNWFKFKWEGGTEILYMLLDRDNIDENHKAHYFVVATQNYGKGEVIVSALSSLNGCIGYNPVLDKFLINLIEK